MKYFSCRFHCYLLSVRSGMPQKADDQVLRGLPGAWEILSVAFNSSPVDYTVADCRRSVKKRCHTVSEDLISRRYSMTMKQLGAMKC